MSESFSRGWIGETVIILTITFAVVYLTNGISDKAFYGGIALIWATAYVGFMIDHRVSQGYWPWHDENPR